MARLAPLLLFELDGRQHPVPDVLLFRVVEHLNAVRPPFGAGLHRPWSLDGGRVEFRPIKESVPDLALGFAWRSDKQLTEIENRFCNYLMVSVDPKAP